MAEPTPENPGKGNHPLGNAKHETFAQTVAAGYTQTEAYKMVYPDAEGENIRITAHLLAKKPHVKVRISWLKETKPPPVSVRVPEKPPEVKPVKQKDGLPLNVLSDQITRDEVIKQLSLAIRGGTTAEITQATQALIKIMPELSAGIDAEKPDPVIVANYLAHWSGVPGHEIAKELGGLELLVRKFAHVLKVDMRELARVVCKAARIAPDSIAIAQDNTGN
jgi:hypothetical protein